MVRAFAWDYYRYFAIMLAEVSIILFIHLLEYFRVDFFNVIRVLISGSCDDRAANRVRASARLLRAAAAGVVS